MSKPLYVLGTGLSHNGSAVLLKDGSVCVAIEKERITRIKHDGGNDSAAIQYCLDAAGITLDDIALVVQSANFETPDRNRFHGKRVFADYPDLKVVTISHHLAHAYSAVGTCNFNDCVVMVIDGCGSPFEQCIDVSQGTIIPQDLEQLSRGGMWCEKDSFYLFDGQRLTPLFKDFSPIETGNDIVMKLPITTHSIGGFYAAVSEYVFGNMDDVGKLMGLAPYGKPGEISIEAFSLENGSLLVKEQWKKELNKPAKDYASFKENFQYYADIAFWAQKQVEKAIYGCFKDRLKRFPHENVCYSGGVALNAVANAFLLNEGVVENFYIEPAAGDNGLALGCAYYGWLEILNKPQSKTHGECLFRKELFIRRNRRSFQGFSGNRETGAMEFRRIGASGCRIFGRRLNSWLVPGSQ